MNPEKLKALLQQVADRTCGVESAVDALRTLPFTEAADALLDTHRELRQGMPEVVFGRNKTTEQIATTLTALHKAHGHALATAVSQESADILNQSLAGGSYDAVSRLFRIGAMPRRDDAGPVCVVCAGTSDIPVAEEAAQMLDFAGIPVSRVYDAGVAGLHRLLAKLEIIRDSRVIIAIAGMEGALPGVLGGLVAQPVIAVPTSVGYGASLGGLSALLTMLNSCSSGLGVVNIDNGFGAAMLAIRILNCNAQAK
jgi:NCAIR mutase (PurE)-related protein